MVERDRPRVAVVRGDALNPFEMQLYRWLPEFDVTAIGRRPAGYEVSLVPVETVLLPGLSDTRAARAARRVGLPVDRILGVAGTLRGLDAALDGADVAHAAETFLPVSDQAAAIARRRGVPLVLTCWENIPFLYDDNPQLAARKARLREQAAMFVAVTPRAKDALVTEGVDPARVRVIPAALDLGRFAPGHDPSFLRSRVSLPEDARIVLYVGRLIREKGVTALLRAFAALPPGAEPVHLVIVGEGPERPRLRTAAASLGVADRVHFLPGQSYADIPRVFRGADVVVVPSLSTPYWEEQFGFVLAEAMACGRPVVTTRTGSIPDVVGPAAHLVDDYDVAALTEGIAQLLTDPESAEKLGRAGRERVEQHYDAEVVAPQWATVYRDVIDS